MSKIANWRHNGDLEIFWRKIKERDIFAPGFIAIQVIMVMMERIPDMFLATLIRKQMLLFEGSEFYAIKSQQGRFKCEFGEV